MGNRPPLNSRHLATATISRGLQRAFLLACVTVAALPTLASASEWVAYNDCVDTDPGSTPPNATSFGLGRSYTGDGESGNLIDFATGADTGVSVEFTENFSAGNTINWATDAAEFPQGSDAEALFGGILDLAGNMSYNDAPGWSLDLRFSNLEPSRSYTFAATIHRNGGGDYQNRISNWTLVGATGSTYASSAAAHKVSELSVEIPTGNNTGGLVARWTDIVPAPDGTFTIRTTHGVGEANGGLPNPDPYRGYSGGLFLLEAQGLGAGAFSITKLDFDAQENAATISWTSLPGCSYAVDASNDLIHWDELSDNVPADGTTTNYIESDLDPTATRRYYRVRLL